MDRKGLGAEPQGLYSLARRLAVSAVLGLAVLAPLSSQGKHDLGRPERPERTVVSTEDIVLYPPQGAGSSFSYLPGDAPIAFDRNVVLSAASGELRSYVVRTRNGAEGDSCLVAYVVDKRRPKAPSADPAPGLYYEAVEPVLSSDAGAAIMWAVVGDDGSAGSFAAYTQTSRPRLAPPASGSATRALLAYAENPSGIRSYPVRFVYRLAERGLPAAQPRDESILPAPDSALPSPKVEMRKGYAEISLPLPEGSSLLADFATDAVPRSIYDFERGESNGSTASLRIPCPYGWSGEVKLYYGVLAGPKASYNPSPLAISLSNPAEEGLAPPAPQVPVVAADPSGSGGFLAFPAYDGAIFVSENGAAPRKYSAPIPLADGAAALALSWYGQDPEGRKSAVQSGVFSLPQGLRDVNLLGVAEGAAISGNVVLKAAPKDLAALASRKDNAQVRYELRIDGSFPPEPGPASPVLGESLSIECPPGEERYVVLRYRSLSDGGASEGRILRFTLDRKPPESPELSELPPAFSDRPLSLDLKPGKGGTAVYASVSVDGEISPFEVLSSPINVPGSDLGPVSYRIRAYSTDAAGNKSPEMKGVDVVVDKASVYAAEDGDDRGDGTPTKPYKTLDAAVAAALKGGKRNVNLRGSLELRSRAQIGGALRIVGGFGEAWVKDSTKRATLVLGEKGGLRALGGDLELRNVDLQADSAPPGAVIELQGATLSLRDASLSAGSDGDIVLIAAKGSKIDISASRIKAARGMSVTGISAEDSIVTVASSSFKSSKDARIFCAVDAEGGSLELRQTLLESRSDLGLSLLSLRSSSLLVDRCVLDARGGSGFLRLGQLKSVSGEIKNSKAKVDWEGPGTLFEISDGGPSFRHDTILASSLKGPMRFFDCRGKTSEIWNSIADYDGPGGELLRSELPLGAGVLAADCFWGFESLVAGPSAAAGIDKLNLINASSALYSSKPILQEPPSASFGSAIKSESTLKKTSSCIGGALGLGAGYETDFGGRPRPAPGKASPDIGADEFYE